MLYNYSMKQFYIYVHCRPNGEPFHVGKGSGKRSQQLTRGRNQYHRNVVAKHGKENILIYTRNCESEAKAFEHERWMKLWCEAQGYKLTNLTDGGGGVSGYRHTSEAKIKIGKVAKITSKGNKNCLGRKDSEETKQKRNTKLKGNKNCLGHKNSLGYRWSKEQKQNLIRTGKVFQKGYIPWNKGLSSIKTNTRLLSSDDELLVADLYCDGWTLSEIATRWDISRMTITRILERMKIPIRKRNNPH